MNRQKLLWNGAHLAVLSAFALAQPLFSLLSDNPEFFAARGSGAFDIVSFAVLLVLVPPALLLLVEFLLGLASDTARSAAHVFFVALGMALILLPVLKDLMGASDVVLIGLAVLAGAGLAAAYARAEPVRSFVSVLSPAPLVFLVLFLFFSPVNKLILEGDASAQEIPGIRPVPVVMVIFDELPSLSLMDERRRVDAERFPAFGRLARDGTWFRNAYTVHDSTTKAVPAIMDGNLPEKGTLPTSSDHPQSIFTVLAGSHRLNAREEATTVCPYDLCEDARLDDPYPARLGSLSEDLGLVWLHVISPPDIEEGLTSVSENWGGFGREQPAGGGISRDTVRGNRRARFESFVASVRAGRRPALDFRHVLLPHVPWRYLPSGNQYRRTATEALPGVSSESYEHQNQLDQLYLRHLLQLRFTDAQLGKLLDRLEDQGIYDDALIVVAADHGVAFEVGESDRRAATEDNVHQIAPVPLFVKRPGQRRGAIDDAYVETIDIFPTVADLLNVDLPEEPDGVSAFSPEVRGRDGMRMLERDLSGFIRLDAEEFERRKAEQLARKVALFGTGRQGERRLFRFGPNAELVGQPASAAGPPLRGASLVQEDDYEHVDGDSGYVPTHVLGRVSGGEPGQEIAIAVNGEIVAVSSTFVLASEEDETVFAVMIPESALRDGANEVEVLEAP